MAKKLSRMEHLKMHALHDMVYTATFLHLAPKKFKDSLPSKERDEWFEKHWEGLIDETMTHLVNCDIEYTDKELSAIEAFLEEALYQWVGEGLGICY